MAGAGTTSASDHHLDIVAEEIHRRFEGLSQPSDCCIFKVPERLRRIKIEAYTPSIIAIGPYHRCNEKLKPMEDYKLLYLQNFLQHDQNYCLEDYLQRVKSWEHDARKCYDKQIDLNSSQFTKMILVDGIFVIELLLMRQYHQRWLRNERIRKKPWMLIDICRDMALLENQIPFLVVQRLFEMAIETEQLRELKLLDLVCRLFSPVIGMELPNTKVEEVKHFVHAIILSFSRSVRRPPNERHIKREMKFTPSATKLLAAGVKLRRRESKCLLDIEFEDGVLNIPYLVLDDMTEYYFRNIIAFEECYHTSCYLTEYLAFMHHLVDTPGDVELLIDKGIIENWLSNKESVARVISNISDGTLISSNYYFHSLSDKLIKHCQKPYNKWKATFKRDYCSSPWVVISVIAAVVLLLLTVAQTVCSVLSLK